MAGDLSLVAIRSLPDVLDDGVALDADGRPRRALVLVDLDAGATAESVDRAAHAIAASTSVVVGVGSRTPPPDLDVLGSALDCSVVAGDETSRWQVGVPDAGAAVARIADAVANAPVAAVTLARLLRLMPSLSVAEGLAAESAAYSMLLAGTEFSAWLDGRVRRDLPAAPGQPVLIDRHGGSVIVTLNVPERHNAYSRWVRDGLVEAMDLVNADSSITDVVVRGAGPSFCSGGDLAEFGTNADPALAHLIRLDRSVSARLDRCRDRVTVDLHGACIGAGIEIAAFAGRVRARPDAAIMLPELAMGLVPGAGGTVGVTRRIGRWRTAYLVLAGETLDLPRAARWGLVDEVGDA